MFEYWGQFQHVFGSWNCVFWFCYINEMDREVFVCLQKKDEEPCQRQVGQHSKEDDRRAQVRRSTILYFQEKVYHWRCLVKQ